MGHMAHDLQADAWLPHDSALTVGLTLSLSLAGSVSSSAKWGS